MMNFRVSRACCMTMVFVLVSMAAMSTHAEDWGSLKGKFAFGGDAPAATPVKITKDAEVCGATPLNDESLVVGEDGGLANVILYMYLKSSDPKPKIHPDYERDAEATVVVDNLKCDFEPRVVLMRTSQTLSIGNKDGIGHNMKIDSLKNPSFNQMVPSGGVTHKMTEVERLPVQMGCNVHPWMKGWLVVKDNPYFAVTDESGSFEIKNIPAGEWTFQVWHEKSGYIKEVSQDGETKKWKKGRMKIDIGAGETDLGTITVPAAAFK